LPGSVEGALMDRMSLPFLRALFGLILISMIGVTAWASQDRSVFQAFGELARDPWGLATLADAYFGFLTFYVWVYYKERTATARGLWLLLILAFGNIAMSLYVLLRLWRLPKGASVESLLLRPPA
jgi:Protein of unknown function (DUF1475)